MGDPEVTARDLYAQLRAILAELSTAVKNKLTPAEALVRYGAAMFEFGGELDSDLIVPHDKKIIWKQAGVEKASIAYNATLNNIAMSGLVADHVIFFYTPTFADIAGKIEADDEPAFMVYALGSFPLWLYANNANIRLETLFGKIEAQDDTENFADLLGEIAGKAATVHTHTEAQITDLDHWDSADSQGEITTQCAGAGIIDNAIDALILAHTGVPAAHHAKYLDAEAVAAMGVKGDANPLHHDKYTDAEATAQADAKITVECGAGQTIDNTIDALIAAHAGLGDAHHSKLHEADHRSGGADALNHDNLAGFVAGEHLAVGAIDHDQLLNFVANEHLLPAAIDHDSLLNYVAAQHKLEAAMSLGSIGTRPITALTATNWRIFYSAGGGIPVELALGAAGTVLTSGGAAAAPTWATAGGSDSVARALGAYGAANAQWFPMSWIMEGSSQNVVVMSGAGSPLGLAMSNDSAANVHLAFMCHQPTNKGSYQFYVTGVKLLIADADAGDYVTATYLLGVTYNTRTEIINDGTNRTAAGSYTTAVAAHACGGYDMIQGQVTTFNTNAYDLDIKGMLVRGYYDT